MGELSFLETLKNKTQNLVYEIVLPIYLWSIGYKTLDEYIEALLDWECARGTVTKVTPQPSNEETV